MPSPIDFRDVLAKIDRHIDHTMNHIISLGLTAGDERHFLKVLEDLYHDIEVSMGVYDE
jgi:hypothetical protein